MTGNGFADLLRMSKTANVNLKRTYDRGLDLCEVLGNLPFCCDDDTLHIRKPDYVTNFEGDGCCLTHRVGLPRDSATNEEKYPTPFQIEFCNRVIHAILGPTCDVSRKLKKLKKEFLKKAHKFHINKGRQMGFTEIVLRIIQYFCFNRYAGYNVGIQAGTNGDLAKKDLRRFALLFKNIKSTVLGWERGKEMILKNDVHVEAFSASEEAMTGRTRYKCVFQDESSKWRTVDDMPVFNSIMPIVNTNGSDLFLVSTPKGPMKMFYKIHCDPKDFIKMRFDIWRTNGNMHTKEKILEMIRDAQEDPNQEYLCEFTIGKGSIFGTVTKEDRSDFIAWSVDDEPGEDDTSSEEISNDTDASDSYVETEEFLFTDEDTLVA